MPEKLRTFIVQGLEVVKTETGPGQHVCELAFVTNDIGGILSVTVVSSGPLEGAPDARREEEKDWKDL